MLLRLSFVALALALVAIGTPVKRDAAQVESDIKEVTEQSSALDGSIKAFPDNGTSATMGQVLNIHSSALNLAALVQTMTSDVTASPPFTDKEVESIFQSLDNLVSIVQVACTDLTAKKSALTSVGAAPTAVDDLTLLKERAEDFEKATLTKIPGDQKTEAQKLLGEFETPLKDALAAYSE